MTIQNDLFLLVVEQKIDHTAITMRLLVPSVNTVDLPNTSSILKIELPSILSSTCFNDKGLSFSKEVQQTEIGHLFEHILLEYLCEKKLSLGLTNIVYNGVTEWDWLKDERGIFYITIDIGLEEKHILEEALQKSTSLISKILNTATSYSLVESSLLLPKVQ